jgi:DNA-binding FadR family transcriptional regulator
MTWMNGKQIDGKTYVEFEHVESLMKSKDDEIERLREALRRVAFNAFKREMVLGEARERFIAIMEANNNAALWQCLEFIGKIATDALGEGKK